MSVSRLRMFIYQKVSECLIVHNNNRVQTAEYLGISVRTLRTYIKEMKILGYQIENGINGRTKK